MFRLSLIGDFRFFWPETIKELSILPQAWDSSLNTGIGKNALDTLWITSYLNFTSSFGFFGLSWATISLFFWVLFSIILSFTSAFLLSRNLFRNNILAFFSGAIYIVNSYFVLILSGGQVGVALAYSVAPFVVLLWLEVLRRKKVNMLTSVLFGLSAALQILFDPRIFYITFLSLLILFTLKVLMEHRVQLAWVAMGLVGMIIAFSLHAYWTVPLFMYGGGNEAMLAGTDSSFFSFAFFENSISLLHPNWPENIFGKVYFQRPEFLLFPIVAFSSLLFLHKEVRQVRFVVIAFTSLALVGAFLGKGFNDPFGNVYPFLLNGVPGFSVFRDPTKWYLLVALSYSLLVPYSVYKIYQMTTGRSRLVGTSFLIVVFLIFAFTMFKFPQIVQSTFSGGEVPMGYIKLHEYITSQDKFFRTLWIPQWQRYGYFSNMNPAIGRNEILRSASASAQIGELNSENAEEALQLWGVKYVIVPYDSNGEIFLHDRKYDIIQYESTIDTLSQISWLKEVNGFGDIKVFEIENSKERFWSKKNGLVMNYEMVSPTLYRLNIHNAQKGDRVIFSENFDNKWVASIINDTNQTIESEVYNGSFNSFVLPEDGSYDIEVFYLPQKYVEFGLWVGALTLGALPVLFVFKILLNKKRNI